MKRESIIIVVKCKIAYDEDAGRDQAIGSLIDACAFSGFGMGVSGQYEYRMTEAKELRRTAIKSMKHLQIPK